jgi:peptidoglycan/xylan/chitin deacetylase (PgdA/CDA1 family)
MTALMLTYHAVEDGPAPLCIAPARFRSQLDELADLGAATLTVSQVVAALRDGTLPDRAVAITFDDGCASAVRAAVPDLVERGMTATFFCVAGHLGGWNDWSTQPIGVPRLELASAAELGETARLGFEIGAHGMEHAPLGEAGASVARRELHDAKSLLEAAVDKTVCSVAYPYGVLPSRAAAALTADLYDAACTTHPGRVVADSDPLALPRVDIHYVRRPELLRRAVTGGLSMYLRSRGFASTLRGAGRP